MGKMQHTDEGDKHTYDTREKETLAILEALHKWEDKLIGRKIRIVTDHESLKYLNDKSQLTYRQVRWTQYLGRFEFSIEHVPGKLNVVADALSRWYLAIPRSQHVPEYNYVSADIRLDKEGDFIEEDRRLEMLRMQRAAITENSSQN